MSENKRFFEILGKIITVRTVCVGDVMLDRFISGTVERISPEAPTPVLLASGEKAMPGGTGNVAANIAALGAKATLAAVRGDDADGADLDIYMTQAGVTPVLTIARDRPTTAKTRFVCGGQHLLRVDRENAAPLAADTQAAVIAAVEDAITRGTDIVILSDYGKGVLTHTVIARAITAARSQGKPVVVDPKGRDFTRYAGAAVITPNHKELEAATGMPCGTDDDVRAAAMKVITACGIGAVLVTRGEKGLSLVTAGAEPLHLPATARKVVDVSGAGDTVISVFACALGAGADMQEAALLANTAAGIVVGKSGTATVNTEEIAQALRPVAAWRGKIVTREGAAAQAERWRAEGKTVGFTNGTFDLLHPGHLSSIRQAKAACDHLVVAANSDASVRRYKGPARPVQDEGARAEILASLEAVDLVVIFEEDTPIELLKAIRPDVLVKGGQYKLEEVVGYDIVMGYGGRIVRADMEDGFSTTNTIKKMAS